MPIYEAECGCGRSAEYFRKVDERDDTPKCECGSKMQRVISAVRGFADLPEYVSPVSGKVVRGRRERRYDLESNNCRPYEGTDTEVREAKRIRARRDKQLDAKIDDQLERTITELDASNKLERVSERADALPDTSNMRTY